MKKFLKVIFFAMVLGFCSSIAVAQTTKGKSAPPTIHIPPSPIRVPLSDTTLMAFRNAKYCAPGYQYLSVDDVPECKNLDNRLLASLYGCRSMDLPVETDCPSGSVFSTLSEFYYRCVTQEVADCSKLDDFIPQSSPLKCNLLQSLTGECKDGFLKHDIVIGGKTVGYDCAFKSGSSPVINAKEACHGNSVEGEFIGLRGSATNVRSVPDYCCADTRLIRSLTTFPLTRPLPINNVKLNVKEEDSCDFDCETRRGETERTTCGFLETQCKVNRSQSRWK